MKYKGVELQVGDKFKNSFYTMSVEETFSNTLIGIRPDGYSAVYSAPELEIEGYELAEREPWKPKENEQYYFVDECGYVDTDINLECVGDIWRYKSGNCFRTEEEAEAYKRSILEK